MLQLLKCDQSKALSNLKPISQPITTMNIASLQLAQNARNKINNALDDCGIGNDLNERFSKAQEQVAVFCANVQRKITSQLLYDLMQNVPAGICQRGDPSYHANRAIKTGLAGAIGSFVKWDVNEALEIAADIAEDVNAHSEAKTIRAMIEPLDS